MISEPLLHKIQYALRTINDAFRVKPGFNISDFCFKREFDTTDRIISHIL